jgi:catalase (peroxidase I)
MARTSRTTCVGPEPAAAGLDEQGFGWKNKCGKGNAEDTVTSGLEGAWTAAPIKWTMMYLTNLHGFEWVQTRSPAGAIQWVPKNADHDEERAGRARQYQGACADHVHHRPVAEV